MMSPINEAATGAAAIHEKDWVAAFFRTVDLCRIEKMSEWFADGIELHFGNNPPLYGKAAAAEVIGGFISTLSGMAHKAETVIVSADGDSASQHAVVTYTKDGRDIAIPAATYLRRNSEKLIDRLWIYIDLAPLYAAAT